VICGSGLFRHPVLELDPLDSVGGQDRDLAAVQFAGHVTIPSTASTCADISSGR
jgi:hypothetical protein